VTEAGGVTELVGDHREQVDLADSRFEDQKS
jgi:hypothetical protein